MAIEKTIILKVDSDSAVKSIDNIDDSIQGVDKSTEALQDTTSSLTNSIDKMTGGLVSGFKNAVGGVRKGVIAMKSLKVAIAATGVGLLVLAFGSLVVFFTKSQKGMDLLSTAMKQFGAFVDVLIDRVLMVGEVLSNIFSKPFSETVDGVTESFKGMGDEMEREIRLAKELELATQKLRDVENDQIVVQAQRRKMIAENRLLAKDQSKSLEERISFLKLAQALENATLLEQQENQAERVRIAEEEYERANSTAEDFKTLQEERARLIDLETDSFNRQRTIVSELESLKNQDRKEGEEEDEESRSPVEALAAQYESFQEITEDGEAAITDEILKQIKIRERNEKAAAEQSIILEKLKQNAKLAIAYNVFGLISEVAEEGSAIAKAAAVAQATISGFQGVQNAFTTASASPITTVFPAYPFIQAGLAGAFSAVQIGKILSTPKKSSSAPSGNVSRGSSSSSSAAVTAPQSPSFNVVGSSGTNQLAETISSKENVPVKTYVTSGDVTTNQELERNIVSAAST